MTAKPNELDVLICDEAHRIRETSANRFARSAERTGRPQLEELIAAARVPVFLLDEHQVVRPGEMGRVADITAYAHSLDLAVHRSIWTHSFVAAGATPLGWAEYGGKHHAVAYLRSLPPAGPKSR